MDPFPANCFDSFCDSESNEKCTQATASMPKSFCCTDIRHELWAESERGREDEQHEDKTKVERIEVEEMQWKRLCRLGVCTMHQLKLMQNISL